MPTATVPPLGGAFAEGLIEAAPDAIIGIDRVGRIRLVNGQALALFGYARGELLGVQIEVLLPDRYKALHVHHRDGFLGSPRARAMGEGLELFGRRKDGSEFSVDVSLSAVETAEGLMAVAFVRDITERKRTAAAVARIGEILAQAQRIGHVGSWEWDVVKDEASWSDGMFRIFGLDPKEPAANRARALTMMHPEDKTRFEDDIKAAIAGPAPYYSEYRVVRSDGQVRYLISQGEVTRDKEGRAIWMVGAVQDLTERTLAEQEVLRSREELAEKNAELGRSNAELEQFAYVASHDLQEPLRMVASYVQLLERRYKGKLDADADDFIKFAVEGSNRMQSLIQDLLVYSRVGSRGEGFVETPLNEPLKQALENLSLSTEDAHATVKVGPLPTARADAGQVVQLFQNLIGNAIKFRGAQPSTVEISGKAFEGWCEITVKDNGIGIDPKYFERIFVIFQRLHSRDEYPGTGIGLAVCRRIVDRHGGRIWLESSEGQGSAFHFTLPAWDKKGGTKR